MHMLPKGFLVQDSECGKVCPGKIVFNHRFILNKVLWKCSSFNIEIIFDVD
jgi:hypothetical protein